MIPPAESGIALCGVNVKVIFPPLVYGGGGEGEANVISLVAVPHVTDVGFLTSQ
jgi:hypothetical protein